MSTTILVTGEALAPSVNPITTQIGIFYIACVVDTDSHRILDAECSATLAVTKTFVTSLFARARITDEGRLTEQITSRYHGCPHPAVLAALRSAVGKYRSIVGLPTD